MTAAPLPADNAVARPPRQMPAWVRDNGWLIGLVVLLAVLLVFTKFVNPFYEFTSIQGLATSVLPLALAAVAQTVVVIAGGIDLSIASQMAVTNCVAAILMQQYPGDFTAVGILIGVLLLGVLLGAVNGALVVATRVPDIIVTLATSFVWAGVALLVTPRPAGSAAGWLKDLVVGPLVFDFLPKAAIVLIVIVAVIWLPLRRSQLGLALYAVGSSRLAAFRSGVAVDRTKFLSYAIAGLFGAFAGLSLTASTGVGTPVPGPDYVLLAIGAVVLGGVSLAGGVGGMIGPVLAVVVLQLVRNDMTFMHVDPNYGLVAQGLIVIAVLVVGSFAEMRRSRA